MILFGMTLVETSSLAAEYQEIAVILNCGEMPELVWSIFCNGNLFAIELTPEKAFDRLMHAKEGLEKGQLPDFQTIAEAELRIDLAQSENTRTSEPEEGSSPNTRRSAPNP